MKHRLRRTRTRLSILFPKLEHAALQKRTSQSDYGEQLRFPGRQATPAPSDSLVMNKGLWATQEYCQDSELLH